MSRQRETGLDEEPATERGARGSDDAGGAVRSVTRALDILEFFVGTPTRPRTVTEIVAGTGLAKTTVLRLLTTLEGRGLLSSSSGGYLPGPAWWRWSVAAQASWELPLEARLAMQALVREYQETANLYIRRGQTRVCVAQEESPLPLRHVVRIGDELPLWAGAAAKILISEAGDGLIRAIHADSQQDPDDAEVFLQEVHQARVDGFAVSHGERETGLSAVGVPVRLTPAPGAPVVAALTFSGPTARFPDERIEHLRAPLLDAAALFTRLQVDHPLRSLGEHGASPAPDAKDDR